LARRWNADPHPPLRGTFSQGEKEQLGNPPEECPSSVSARPAFPYNAVITRPNLREPSLEMVFAHMDLSFRTLRFLALVLVPLVPGCSEELGPVPIASTRVTGVVLEGKRPVRGGFIDFVPIDGAVGNLRSAPIGADGRFAVDGVAIGSNAIGLVALKASMPVRSGMVFDTLRTTIRRTIAPGPSSVVTIDLCEELVRYQRVMDETAN
jgi:hypothetical protein